MPLRSILLLSSHLRLTLSSGPFSSGFPSNIAYAILVFPLSPTCLTYVILLDVITVIMSKNYEALYYAVLSSLLLLPPS